jgi:hypothetical protein
MVTVTGGDTNVSHHGLHRSAAILSAGVRGKHHLKDLGVNGLLKYLLRKGWKLRTGFFRLL